MSYICPSSVALKAEIDLSAALVDVVTLLMVTEQSLSVEDKVLLAQVASERAAIVAKYDKVRAVVLHCILLDIMFCSSALEDF